MKSLKVRPMILTRECSSSISITAGNGYRYPTNGIGYPDRQERKMRPEPTKGPASHTCVILAETNINDAPVLESMITFSSPSSPHNYLLSLRNNLQLQLY
jgi:hypothetical protein